MKIKWKLISSVWIEKAFICIGLDTDSLIQTCADQQKKLLGQN